MSYTYIDEDIALDRFRDELDELHNVSVIGISFCASRVLEELDPIAFNCSFSDWLDANDLTTELIKFAVELVEENSPDNEDGEKDSIYFYCDAEDADHAKEQAEDAYKNCDVLDIEEV